MNEPQEASRTTNARPAFVYPRTISAEGSSASGVIQDQGQTPGIRRGHSDGDLLSPFRRDPNTTAGSRAQRTGYGAALDSARTFSRTTENKDREQPVLPETWQDFLRQVPSDIDAAQRQQAFQRVMSREGTRGWTGSSTDNNTGRRFPAFVASARNYNQHSGQRPHAASDSGEGNMKPSHSRSQPSTNGVNRPLPRLPSFSRHEESRDDEHVVPSWQPDAEVSNCPICGHTFSFFFRKHHCRKCGRVVCANCSPHRITIPRQFIVHPPSVVETDAQGNNVEIIDLTGDEDTPRRATRARDQDHLHPALGGGQEVRLCNPCVPDPNPLPPPSYASSTLMGPASFPPAYPQSESLDTTHTPRWSTGSTGSLGSSRRHSAQLYGDSHSRNSQFLRMANPTSLHSQANHPSSPQNQQRNPFITTPTTPFGSAPHSSSSYPSDPRLANRSHHRSHASVSGIPSRYRSMLDITNPVQPSGPVPPPPQIREEDECPICHCELPPKGPDGSETAREAHVVSCIETHFSSSGPCTRMQPPPPPRAAVAAAVAASSATPAQAGGSSSAALVGAAAGAAGTSPVGPGAGSSARRRTTGMVVYQASEKDCVGENGGPQECVICFEEFEPGVGMGRLECLCKFHKTCIRQWWDTKGVGACPVHQGGLN